MAGGVAASRCLHVDVSLHPGYPPTVNHDAPMERLSATAERVGLRVHTMPSPVMGAEDFSYMMEKVPGSFAFLGARTDGGGPLHSDLMKIDEGSLQQGAALHAAVAISSLMQA